jgi:hypothetical protein
MFIPCLHQYRDFIAKCPAINTAVILCSSATTKSGFDYGVLPAYQPGTEVTMDITDQPRPPSGLDDGSYVLDIMLHQDSGSVTIDQPNQEHPAAEEHPSTPKQTNVFPPRASVGNTDDYDGSITTSGTMDHLDPTKDSESVTTEEASGFHLVHYRLVEVVNSWMNQEAAKKYPFFLKWQKAAFAGLDALTKWDRIAQLFKLSGLSNFINLMNECPVIHETYELTWDFFTNTIQLKELALPTTPDVIHDIIKLNDLQRQMKHLAYKFDSCMKDYHTRLAESDARIMKYEFNLSEQLNRASSRFATSATRHYNSLSEFASSTLEKFQRDITDITDKNLSTQRRALTDMNRANLDAIQAHLTKTENELTDCLHDAIATAVQSIIRDAEQLFKKRLDAAMETALQELLTTANDATEHMNQQAESLLRNMEVKRPTGSDSWKHALVKPSKLFPNVDVGKFVTTPVASTTATLNNKNTEPIATELEWGKDGPESAQAHNESSIPHHVQFNSLPPVCHTDMLKRVHLPYPGCEQSYLWYLQLKSNGQQYGVYLISTEQFKKNKSLCPTEIYGVKVDVTRYNEMKCTLYHFLAQRTIITVEYTDIRNIINRNAMTTDGYRVLYDIMARIHPALNTDNIFTAPRVTDYSDIHEYYTYLDSYLMHEKYAGRVYHPREQLNRFLSGLDATYAPAIARIRNQLDNWNGSDNSVPENLQLANLPVLVDQYMEDQDDGAAAVVRYVSKGHHRSKIDKSDKGDATKPTDAIARPYVDVKCPLCQSFGHHKYNCDRMALWLNLKEGSESVDDKLRIKIHANYADVDAKRRAKKLGKLKGTVRQLYQRGQFEEGETLLTTAIPQLTSGHAEPHLDASDFEASSES